MIKSLSTRIAFAVLAIGLAGSVVGLTAGNAIASTAPKSHHATGSVKTVSATTDKLTITVGKKTDSSDTTSMTTVTIAKLKSALGALKVGEEVTVTYPAAGKVWTATAITSPKA